jgi:chloramphenicol-sensitive protein RarD
MRKTMPAGAVEGLFIETAICLPLTIGYIAWEQRQPQAVAFPLSTHALLAFSGIVTATPLLLFAAAARRLRLTTLGFLQYLSPTLQFLIAVLVFNEPFTTARQITFGLIWLAVTIFLIDQFRAARHAGDASRHSEVEAPA